MALAILRTIQITVSNIKILFSDELDPNIGIGNVSITSNIDSVRDPDVISVSIDSDIITINFRPLFPNVQYKIVFSSTDSQPFQTINGDRITEDGKRNFMFITSPGENESSIRDSMFESLSEIYETDKSSFVRDLISSMANEFQKTNDVIDTVHAANYLSILVEDERMTRDDGPIDRFANGGVFEVLRVASTPTGTDTAGSLRFDDDRLDNFQTDSATIINSVLGALTEDPISLQAIDVVDEQVSDDTEQNNFFSGLRIKVSKGPVIQVISVMLDRDDELISYDVERFGYTLKSNRYDTNSASTNVNLSDREIDLSISSLTGDDGGFFVPEAGDEIIISYVYKKLGREVDSESVQLTTLKSVVREIAPSIINIFSLEHAPIVNEDDDIPITGGVTFLNTQAVDEEPPFSTTHPAFTREIAFDLDRLPARAGEYSVNYNTGQVYVFGEDQNNRGTGDAPPAANYTYRQIFTTNLDYTFNSDREELAINSTRNLEGITAKITFDYEDTFAKDIDYAEMFHVESLNERIENKLVSDFKLQTAKFPITDVFRVFNETTGEIYTPVRFSDTTVTFSGRQAPRQKDITRERVSFSIVSQETLLISDELDNSSNLRIFKIELENNGITDSSGRFVGANFNTSVVLSDTDIFVSEKFYEDELFDDLDTNLDRLDNVGEYLIDYSNGIIYVAVDEDQDSNIGDISYRHKKVQTRNGHILKVNNIYRSANALRANLVNYSIGDITDNTVTIGNLEKAGERFLNNDGTRPILIGSYQSGSDGITAEDVDIFTSNSATFTTDDLQRTLVVGSTSQTPIEEVIIVGIINTHQVVVDTPFTTTLTGRAWDILDLSEAAAKTITLANNIISIRNIYIVTQLGTLSAGSLDGYFDINRDSFEENVITLGTLNPLQVGDAIIVDYNFGDIFVDYTYLQDEILVSYEYGNNSLDWSIGDVLQSEDEYFVTYKYGAMRESLLSNFGALTQIPELTNFSPNLNREVYRSIIGGTLQSFVEGPTISSIERLVEAFTDVTPNIRELIFDSWILGRDFLHPRAVETSSDITFDLGKFNNGIVIDESDFVKVPAVSHLKLNEGTIEAWVRPNWKGLANDATLTFDLTADGYSDASKVYIGFSASNPEEIPFDLNISDTATFGEPSNIDEAVGFFIWFDEFADQWNIYWRESLDADHTFSGTISTSGEFYRVTKPTGNDGYSINEITDTITSSIKTIKFEATIDCDEDGTNSLDGGSFLATTFHCTVDGGSFSTTSFNYEYDGGNFTDTEFSSFQERGLFSTDGISFASGDIHYLFDLAYNEEANRMAIFKDGTGFLNFQVIDNRSLIDGNVGLFNLSTDITGWNAGELHQIATSWRFNSDFEQDEMHLFVDGEEVPNLFKYGGNPKVSSSFDFGNVGEELVISAATRPIVGGFDGSTTSGSNIFRSVDIDFESSGIEIGDNLYILESTPDGEDAPNSGLPYSVTGVGSNTVTVDRNFTLTLGSIHFSFNHIVATITTPINYQDFIVQIRDADGNNTEELAGVDADEPDYSIRRGDDNSHVLTINNGVPLAYRAVVKTLGLLFRRARERVFVYGDTDEIRLLAAPPVTLSDVNIYAVTLPRSLISTDNGFSLVSSFIDSEIVTLLEGSLDGYYAISNTVAGRRLSINLSGGNIDYSENNNNSITLIGETYSGATSEILYFNENDTIITAEYWTVLDRAGISVIPIDTSNAAGTIEIREYKSIAESENNGDYAEITDFSNGVIKLETFGTGGTPYILNYSYYDVDYPSFLRIRFGAMPDTFNIGSDAFELNQFDGTIDEFRVLNNMMQDTRAGEVVESEGTSVTTDFNATSNFETDDNTLLLLHFNDNVEDISEPIDRFDSGFQVAPSLNDDFDKAIRFEENHSYTVSNAGSIFNNDEGTIEFWINPLDDVKDDPNFHYFIDLFAVITEEITSSTSISLELGQRARSIESVRLATDTFNTGTNYFTGGSISTADRKTITLGIPLPDQNTDVKVTFVPLDSQGDRVSIYRDPDGFVNFYVKALDVEHLISVHVDWDRHTWHRVMVMWTTNSADNEDRLRLFVDGTERGTIKYGTGLIYGTGVIYGQEEVRPNANRFIVDNIDLTDTFSSIYIGTDVFGSHGARALMDNIRFSDIERLETLIVTDSDVVDINYVENVEFAIPVVSDDNTTAIFDFNKESSAIEFFATLINAERGIFRFEVEVVDSFDKVIGNTQLEELLVELINTLKPAHSEAIITFTK